MGRKGLALGSGWQVVVRAVFGAFDDGPPHPSSLYVYVAPTNELLVEQVEGL